MTSFSFIFILKKKKKKMLYDILYRWVQKNNNNNNNVVWHPIQELIKIPPFMVKGYIPFVCDIDIHVQGTKERSTKVDFLISKNKPQISPFGGKGT